MHDLEKGCDDSPDTIQDSIAVLEDQLNLPSSRVVGAGGQGLIVQIDPIEVQKLFYNLKSSISIQKEAAIQQKVRRLLLPTEVGVPKVSQISSSQTLRFRNETYLCGIGMEQLPPPSDFEEAVHMLLGQNGNDLDTSWGQAQSFPVSETNPTRGFFASPTMMEAIWEEEGSDMTIERLAGIMGKTYRILLDHGIVPIDVEWIWSKKKPQMIDFGLCEERFMDPQEFLQAPGVSGLGSDFQVPHAGDRGQEAFLEGFL